MRKRCYPLFVVLTISSLLTILIVTIKEAQLISSKLGHEEDAECEWKMLHDPAMQSSNHAKWNASLLLSLGLLAPRTSHGVNNGSRISPTVYQSKPRCHGYQDRIKSQLTFKKMLKEMSSNPNLLCQTLRNLTDRAESCFNLDSDLNEFLNEEHGLNETWRSFHPPEVTSRILTTLQVYKAIRLKRLSSKPTIISPMPEDAIHLRNSTFIFRIFVLIESLHPLRFFIFQEGVVLLDQENRLLPFEFGPSSHGQALYSSAVRWLRLYLEHVKLLLKAANQFEYKYDEVSQILSANFYPTPNGMQLLRIHDNVQHLRSKSTPHSLHLLLHKITSTSVQYLSIRHSSPHAGQIRNILNGTYYEEIFGLISSLIITPLVELEPAFQQRWTHYTAIVPYEITLLNIQLVLNDAASGILLESESARDFNVSIGLGWNDFRIKVNNKDAQIRPIVYILRIKRLHRPDNPQTFHGNISVCILEQECSLKFKEKSDCGLQVSPFGNWNSALTDWDRLPTCPFGNTEEGAWMVPCSSCLVERSCYWSRARWQPFECRYPLYSPSKLQQCLLHRKLIFVGDSTNRGMMESLLERLDGWLTTSDSTKWHSYRHRLANIGGQTQLHFDYYPKFWMSTRTTLEQTLVHILHRAEARENDTTLIIGGLDWMSTQHFDTIRQVLTREGLSGMAVVIKMSGAGFQSGRREGPVSTARRLGRLSQTARLHYGFRTVDTWNMTVAKFRDFLPGRCRCHFHQITEVGESDPDSIADAMSAASSPRRFRTDGPINQAYTGILADQLCRNEITL